MKLKRLLVILTLLSSTASALGQSKQDDGRQRDRDLIRAHIESIFQAFIDWDVDKIYATHSEDWRGFLEGSRTPIKGLDEYMRANGIDWPKVKGSKPSPDSTRGYKIKDFDVMFYGPDLAVANFIGEFENKTGAASVTTTRLRIMDVYAKRKGGWIQVASHTVTDPAWRAEQTSTPGQLGPQMRKQLLDAREAVWRAFFSNDRAALEKLIPQETITIDPGTEAFSGRAEVLAGASEVAKAGGKLTRLEFPRTDVQLYGNVAIIYTTYLYELDVLGKKSIHAGRATEIFVRRNGNWVNSGWHLDTGK